MCFNDLYVIYILQCVIYLHGNYIQYLQVIIIMQYLIVSLQSYEGLS